MSKLALMTAALICGIAVSSKSVAAGSDFPIAGLNPSERPAGAPVIRQLQRPQSWFAHALTGITPPYPPSLKFLEDQGDWYTPFIHPGMPGRYDIRGWFHR